MVNLLYGKCFVDSTAEHSYEYSREIIQFPKAFKLTDIVTAYSLFTLGELEALSHSLPELLFCAAMWKETAGKQANRGGAEGGLMSKNWVVLNKLLHYTGMKNIIFCKNRHVI